MRILKFLSNVNNYNNVIVCAFDNGCFIERPENFQHQCLFLMHDATERSNLMGNITEKTQFVSDHASKFLSLILKNEQKLSDIFPSFQIKYHMENSVISHILDFSKPSSNVSYHFPKCVMVERKKLFFENTRKLLFLEFEENDKVSLDFCKNFFHPESILKVDNFVLFKYDAKYRISVDLITELRNKEADGSVQELTNEGLINKYPSLYNQENLHTEYM
ncbi:hypothetical protein TRFO_20682 [Tritrichomonas foetus]|uniref:Uncharacterized protein n=1 Tax=Tritrichomonas foetus TaxID=1144522 RepID=A0A1J4KGG1_9EUKA|nr:hypothetical protein TRFO_20682 [Tritrichomonas foetus]|eukprot:OHT10138.1 hypothetical protein TRFO_20682 [Tritrichomonas foetus]